MAQVLRVAWPSVLRAPFLLPQPRAATCFLARAAPHRLPCQGGQAGHRERAQLRDQGCARARVQPQGARNPKERRRLHLRAGQ
eukprot:1450000-Pyramimonas_sp.AAC.1